MALVLLHSVMCFSQIIIVREAQVFHTHYLPEKISVSPVALFSNVESMGPLILGK